MAAPGVGSGTEPWRAARTSDADYPARHILVLYGSRYGQTAKIARRITRALGDRGGVVDLIRGDELPAGFSFNRYDGVIVGASLIGGHHQRYIERLVRAYRDDLNRRPSAFFSVSGSACDPGSKGQADARRCLDDFLEDTGWCPILAVTLAGAIQYTRYSPLVRWIMKWISWRAGGSTDTTRDHEYTNWAQVEQFAVTFDAWLAGADNALGAKAREPVHSH